MNKKYIYLTWNGITSPTYLTRLLLLMILPYMLPVAHFIRPVGLNLELE